MDWHERGHTSIIDFLAATDIGKRSIAGRDGRQCAEYYAYQDGLPVKVVCPKGPPPTEPSYGETQ
jgi:hypothetical protein